MSKDPAFLFYPGDYIGGTMGMTFEEKGAYMDLLMMQFNRGHMTTHMIVQTIGNQLWNKVQSKFVPDKKGLWYNSRLEEEQIKRKNYTESRRNNVSGVNQHTKKDENKVGHMTSHMENENKDKNISKNKDKKRGSGEGVKIKLRNKIPPSLKMVSAYCEERDKNVDPEKFVDFYQSKNWMIGKNKMVDWQAAVRNWEKSQNTKPSHGDSKSRNDYIRKGGAPKPKGGLQVETETITRK